MSQLISNVLMQPRLDAVERPMTLIEKLEKDLEYNLAIKESRTEPLEHSHYYAYCDAMENAINIVKQHQAESGWVAYEDERKPKDKSRVLAFDGRREFIALYDKGFYIVANGEYYGCITHWMELPSPPHDSKGGAYERDLYQIEKEKGKFFEPSEVNDD